MRAIRTLAALVIAMPCASQAVESPDGVYDCWETGGGYAVHNYVTFHTHPDGGAAFGVAAMHASEPVYGYGIGIYSGGAFSGTTDRGHSAGFVISGGQVNGYIDLVLGGNLIHATVSCTRIW